MSGSDDRQPDGRLAGVDSDTGNLHDASSRSALAVCVADLPPSDWLRAFRRKLRCWHARHGRRLPWRAARDPYHVWVSEIMLQQTTVAAVIPYYERFLAALPTLAHLAAAEEHQVLRLWEGLGYYRRARHLQQAARVVLEQHGGRLPEDIATLQSLPGVGRYTAGAIASFGYGRPAPIVEANTLRLYSRLLGFDGDPRSRAGQQLLWAFAEVLLPARDPGGFNQALIDLGATICTPTAPICERCPVKSLCRAYAAGRQHELPRTAARPEFTQRVECAVMVRHRGRYLVRRCQPGERWAGLWDFPRFALNAEAAATVASPRGGGRRAAARERHAAALHASLPAALRSCAAAEVERLTGQRVAITGRWEDLRHGVTRYRIQLVCLTAEPCSGERFRPTDHLRWVSVRELEALPMSSTARKLSRRLTATVPGDGVRFPRASRS